MRARQRAGLILVVIILVAGCGGGGGNRMTSSTPSSQTGLTTSGSGNSSATTATTPTAAGGTGGTTVTTPTPANPGGAGTVTIPEPASGAGSTVGVVPSLAAGEVLRPSVPVDLPDLAPAPVLSIAQIAAALPAESDGGTDIRRLEVGDVLIATVTGTVTSGASSGPVEGRLTASLREDLAPPHIPDATALRMVTQWDLAMPSGPTVIVRNQYLEQGSNNSIYGFGWSDSTTRARWDSGSKSPMLFESPTSDLRYYSYTALYEDGSTEDVTWTVLGQEVVNGCLTYRIHITTAMTLNGTVTTKSEDYWFLPSIGYPIKWTTVMQEGTTVYDLTATLLWNSYKQIIGPGP